ncbi:hypothetical protein SESBI_41520 [Sesbania bispinosa]|nr:hypothetical protein SESBI_41520 [Sesbania bispinosa]
MHIQATPSPPPYLRGEDQTANDMLALDDYSATPFPCKVVYPLLKVSLSDVLKNQD